MRRLRDILDQFVELHACNNLGSNLGGELYDLERLAVQIVDRIVRRTQPDLAAILLRFA